MLTTERAAGELFTRSLHSCLPCLEGNCPNSVNVREDFLCESNMNEAAVFDWHEALREGAERIRVGFKGDQ